MTQTQEVTARSKMEEAALVAYVNTPVEATAKEVITALLDAVQSVVEVKIKT